ncbi:hypothetical protein M407DRAFT_18349 [Tulasnella calospora MUT 4182]|uniref:Uncharacterized protein n=1 Tax=Tulasnella calospora MUT 4182 TaxID=1051891 RepID=A0A0C3QKA3_9AGAM|nr:hypothetical protein M407DRAFT_18349 [Tulasnella calospora MUT 4182]
MSTSKPEPSGKAPASTARPVSSASSIPKRKRVSAPNAELIPTRVTTTQSTPTPKPPPQKMKDQSWQNATDKVPLGTADGTTSKSKHSLALQSLGPPLICHAVDHQKLGRSWSTVVHTTPSLKDTQAASKDSKVAGDGHHNVDVSMLGMSSSSHAG